MTIRCTLQASVRSLLLAMALLLVASAAGKAQAVDCNHCDHFTFAVRADLNCSVTICYVPSPIDDSLCITVAPGGSVRIPCDVSRVWVKTCSGNYSIIPANAVALCSGPLKFASDCCGKICIVPSLDTCPRLEVQPLPCAGLGCP